HSGQPSHALPTRVQCGRAEVRPITVAGTHIRIEDSTGRTEAWETPHGRCGAEGECERRGDGDCSVSGEIEEADICITRDTDLRGDEDETVGGGIIDSRCVEHLTR